METDIKKLENLIAQLVALGEDKRELNFWKDFFPLMDEDKQKKLIDNLQNQLSKLKK